MKNLNIIITLLVALTIFKVNAQEVKKKETVEFKVEGLANNVKQE